MHLSTNADIAHMVKSLENGPLSELLDLEALREINPELLTFSSWLATSGRNALNEALSPSIL